MKIPLFDSLVWGSLRLTPIILIATLCVPNFPTCFAVSSLTLFLVQWNLSEGLPIYFR